VVYCAGPLTTEEPPVSTTAIFRSLHQQRGQPLVLANIWDAGGARLVASLGARAVATTSAGVAWSLGYADGNTLPFDELAHVVRGVVGAVSVPVTIDVEAGYSDDPATVVERLKPVFESGIAGINIEDGADAPGVLARKIEAIKHRTASLGLDLFVNVRTDVYLRNLSPDDKKVAETLKRANTYQLAGADGLFVPGIKDGAQIGEVASGTELPLNVMCVPGLPRLQDLAQLNVRRLSAGSALSQALWQHLARLAQKFLTDGDSSVFAGEGMEYGRLQALFSGPRE
jgi:2-methylisocitrate lyase-like PEP mutase family enzyme